jgi:Zn-finger nucleic acid-binding protein
VPDDARRDEPFEAATARGFRCPSCGAPVAAADASCAHCHAPLATARCVACFQLNPKGDAKCGRCGALLPSAELEAAPRGPCPECRAPLVAKKAGVIGYAECTRCGGLFLAPAAFDAVTHEAEGRGRVAHMDHKPGPRPPGAVRYRHCPVCGTLMNRANYGGASGVVIDTCRGHGAFFDSGELTTIVAFLEGGGWEKAKKRERERLAEEVKGLEARKSFNESIALPASVDEDSPPGLLIDVLSWLAGFFAGKR